MTDYVTLPLEAIKITNRKHEVIDASGDTVCRVVAPKIGVDGGNISTRSAEYRTALIVRAVNAHGDLVEALEEAIAVIERIKPPEYGGGTIVRGRDALARAGVISHEL